MKIQKKGKKTQKKTQKKWKKIRTNGNCFNFSVFFLSGFLLNFSNCVQFHLGKSKNSFFLNRNSPLVTAALCFFIFGCFRESFFQRLFASSPSIIPVICSNLPLIFSFIYCFDRASMPRANKNWY